MVDIGEVTVIEEGGVTDGGGAITRSIGLTLGVGAGAGAGAGAGRRA